MRLRFAPLLILSVSYCAAEAGTADKAAIYIFTGKNGDGAGPGWGGVAIDSNGLLYGTTEGGGSSDNGTVFQLAPPASPGAPWTETVLYSFTGKNGDGWSPAGGVVIGANGNLYGTTEFGGAYTDGTVFELSPPSIPGGPWTESVIHSFSDQNGDGSIPFAGVVIGKNGSLYGTTELGGAKGGVQGEYGNGIVFELSPPAPAGGAWTETVLYRFKGKSDGSLPQSSVAVAPGGKVYGTTRNGGNFRCVMGCGVVFELGPPSVRGGQWSYNVLHRFRDGPRDGSDPGHSSVAISGDGKLYGSTTNGGRGESGIVFELARPSPNTAGLWNETIVYNFPLGDRDRRGSVPDGGVVIGPTGVLYGTAEFGGKKRACCGTVFALTPAASPGKNWTAKILYRFQGGKTDGSIPDGALAIGPHGELYGTTDQGGVGIRYGDGTVFEVIP